MGEKYHSAYRCDPELLRSLGEVATRAVAARSSTLIYDWHLAHRDRYDLHDSVVQQLDPATLDELRYRLVRCLPSVAEPADALRLAAGLEAQTARMVSRTALLELHRSLERALSRIEWRATSEDRSLQLAQLALTALDTGDLHRRLAEVDELYAGFEECVRLCCAHGFFEDIGLDQAAGGPSPISVAGTTLVFAQPIPADPDPDLLARVIAREGVYHDIAAGELLHDDWREIVGSLDYVPPIWGIGADLIAAECSMDQLIADLEADAEGESAMILEELDELEPEDRELRQQEIAEIWREHARATVALERYQRRLREAAADGDAVVEWVRKF